MQAFSFRQCLLDHLCRNTRCVNPAHLEVVTGRENKLRGIGFPALNAAKTHCKRGHEFTEDNTYLYRGHRHCRACDRMRGFGKRERRRQRLLPEGYRVEIKEWDE